MNYSWFLSEFFRNNSCAIEGFLYLVYELFMYYSLNCNYKTNSALKHTYRLGIQLALQRTPFES